MAFVGRAKPAATVSARVLDKDGNVIEDLGVIASPEGMALSKTARKALRAKLNRLKKQRRQEEHDGS